MSAAALHVADVGPFSTASVGARRYLQEKRLWMQAQPDYHHSLVLPCRTEADELDDEVVELPGLSLPFSRSGRVPLGTGGAYRTLLELRPDIIETADNWQLAWGALDAGQELGVPVVHFCHNDFSRSANRMGGQTAEKLAEVYARNLYTRFDHVLAPSQYLADRLIELGVPHAQHQTLGVDTITFHPSSASKGWRLRLGAAPGERLLVFAGRFATEKNLPTLYAMLDQLGPGYKLILVGNGTRMSEHPAVQVVPYFADSSRLAAVIASCDVFVHAGTEETSGIAALEAMACGVPVVAAQAGALAEVVDSNVGSSVPAANLDALAEGMAEAVRRLCADDLQPLREAARLRAEDYDWARIMPNLAARYSALGHHVIEPLTVAQMP